MKLDSPLFNRIRVKPEPARKPVADAPVCQWPGCDCEATHRAPKGRLRENQYWQFCLEHVREYNASYNYFAGMSDDAVAAYQKDAVIGHRPTFPIGVNAAAKGPEDAQAFARDWAYIDPLGVLRGEGFQKAKRAAAEAPKRRYSGVVQRALDTLGL